MIRDPFDIDTRPPHDEQAPFDHRPFGDTQPNIWPGGQADGRKRRPRRAQPSAGNVIRRAIPIYIALAALVVVVLVAIATPIATYVAANHGKHKPTPTVAADPATTATSGTAPTAGTTATAGMTPTTGTTPTSGSTATPTSGATATPTATPSSAPTGTLFWQANFETGTLSQFGSVHTGMPSWGNSSATVVRQGGTITGLQNDGSWTAPAPRSGTYAVGLLVDGPAADVGSAGGQRAELTSGYMDTVNTERWYGLSVYLPSTPNRNAAGGATNYNNAIWQTGWGTSLNLKTSADNDPTGDSNAFQIADAAHPQNGWSAAWYHIGPILYDQWVDFTIHVYWATDTTGYFEVYENGHLVTLTGLSDRSFRGTRATGPTFGVASQMVSEFDWYRSAAQNVPNLLYLDDLKIGTTYAIVQPG